MRNERGFTLAELAVTLGISSLFTVMFMRYTLNTQNQDRHLRYQASINETLNTLYFSLNKPDLCTKMLKDKMMSSGGTDVPGGLVVDGRPILTVGTYQDFDIQSIKLATSTLTTSGTFDLLIRFTPRTTSILNSYFAPSSSVVDKRIPIVGVKIGSLVKSCGPIISDSNLAAKQAFCTSIGSASGSTTALGKWDTTANKCVLSSFKCLNPANPYLVPNSFNASGITCTDIMNRINVAKIFDFGMKDCSTKIYTIYQDPVTQLLTIGCLPTAAQKSYQGVLNP